MRSVRITCALALAALVACSKSATQNTVAACLTGFTQCGDNCVDTTSDAEHCGGCGNVCSETGAVCRASTCIIPCETQLRTLFGEIGTDAAGYVWPKAPMTNASGQPITYSWSTGRALCDGAGPNPRLPTATELHRLAQDATLRPASAAAVWALTADGPTRRFKVTLGGGGGFAAAADATSARNALLCVCPPAPPTAFTGNACYGGAAAGACFSQATPKVNLDAFDRPALTKAGAIWECGFYGGHLPLTAELTAAVALGLPNGTNVRLALGEDGGSGVQLASWSATNLSSLAFSYEPASTLHAFRCMGPSDASFSAPEAEGVQPPGPGGPLGIRGDAADTAAAPWLAAVDACWNKGGHLPTATELASLVNGVLPDGSDAALWTADLVTNNAVGWYTTTYRWGDAVLQAPYDGPSVQSLRNGQGAAISLPFRCAYYPVDPAYVAPASCEGGCQLGAPSGQAVRMWIDNADREPATFTAAVTACAALGARLPTIRDVVELTRNAHANGNGGELWTSDFIGGDSALAQWNGSAGSYSPDDHRASQTVNATATKPFRCLWTNELR